MSEAGAATDTVTAGTLLREAREAAGLHVATLAANLKVPVRKLEALEEDRYDLLPDAVFVRALASSVCRTLKVDPQPVLQRLPQTAQPRLVHDSKGINAPFRAPGDGRNPGVLDHLGRPVVLIVVALLVGALVLVFLPVSPEGDASTADQSAKTDPVMPPGGADAQPQVTTAISPALPANPVAQPASGAGAVPTAAALTPAPDPARAAVTPGAQSPVAAASAAPAASASGPAAGVPLADGIVVFRTRGASWVQVTDAGGTTVLRRLMTAGESAAANGRLPLSVTVGDARQTAVQVRGKAFDLAPLARDNVARFEVK
jgi:cytoskeleton protein RodZ